MASAIPPELRMEVVHATGRVIVDERPRGGGGASRQGAEIMLRAADGTEQYCYLAWDGRAGDPSRMPYFERETAILRALSGPFAEAGVRIAPLIAAFPSHLALLSTFIPGQDRFPQAHDKPTLARDFIDQLAALHRLDAADPAFAVLGDARELPSVQIGRNIAAWRELNLASGTDPIVQLALTWLGRNIPPDTGPSVVLHGDAGPGNFLYRDNRVEALIDWELTHLGDPMEDLAQIWVRSLIQPFVPMAEVFAAYEAASGSPVDVARVKYHRLYFQLSFTAPSYALASTQGSQVSATGTGLLFGTMHRRVIVRSVAELAGVVVRDPAIPEIEPDIQDRYFATALKDLREDIVPAAGNQRAASKAKELARLIKFWRCRSSHGALFDAQELAEIRAAMPTSPDDLPGARAMLARAIAQEEIDFAVAVQLCHNRVVRETFVMAEAMGTLATTWYEDIA